MGKSLEDAPHPCIIHINRSACCTFWYWHLGCCFLDFIRCSLHHHRKESPCPLKLSLLSFNQQQDLLTKCKQSNHQ